MVKENNFLNSSVGYGRELQLGGDFVCHFKLFQKWEGRRAAQYLDTRQAPFSIACRTYFTDDMPLYIATPVAKWASALPNAAVACCVNNIKQNDRLR